MAVWLLWEPITSTFFLSINREDLPETKSCSLCKRKKLLSISRSAILIDREIKSYLGKEIISLDNDHIKNVKKRIFFPLIGDEWSISLSRDHSNSLTNIPKDNFRKAFYVLLREVKKAFGSGLKKHVYCFSLFNLEHEGTLFHPQFRCIAVNHLYLASLFFFKTKEPCLLCKLFTENLKSNVEDVIYTNERFLVINSSYEEAVYIISKNHYNFTKIDLRRLADDLSTVFIRATVYLLSFSNKKYGLDTVIFSSLDFVKKEHIYGRVISFLPNISFDDKIRRIIADRYARYITGPLI